MFVLYSNLLSLNIEFLILDQLNNFIRNKNHTNYYTINYDNVIANKIINLTDKLISYQQHNFLGDTRALLNN